MIDRLARMQEDPGTRTLGELLQDREWACHEIERLRARIQELERGREPVPVGRSMVIPQTRREPLDDRQLLRSLEVRRLTGLSHVTLWRLMKKGRFPRSIKVSDRATRWRASDVFAWMEERAAQRR